MSVPVMRARQTKQLLRRILLSNATVTDLVGDRIRTQHDTDPSRTNLHYPVLVIEMLYGVGGYEGAWQSNSFDLWCYSNQDQGLAAQVYDEAYLILQAQRLFDATGTISAAGYARELERPIDGYDERIGANYVRGRWSISTAG